MTSGDNVNKAGSCIKVNNIELDLVLLRLALFPKAIKGGITAVGQSYTSVHVQTFQTVQADTEGLNTKKGQLITRFI